MSNYIYSIKLYITHFCPLRCKYCFVDDKWNKAFFDKWFLKDIKNIFELYWWKIKNLYILWWEPLFYQDLVCEIIEYFLEIEWINIIIVTSWVYKINEKIINYLYDRNNIKISFSIDWLKKNHDINRIFQNNTTSWNIVFRNILQFKNLNHDDYNNYGVITIDNNLKMISDLYKSFLNLHLNLWFSLIHIWDVDWNLWDNEKKLEYIYQLSYILKYIYLEHKKWKYIYLSLFNRYLMKNNDFLAKKSDYFFVSNLKMLDIDINWRIWMPFEMLNWSNSNISSLNRDYKEEIWLFLKSYSKSWWIKIISWRDLNLYLYNVFELYSKKFSEDYLENIFKYNLYI